MATHAAASTFGPTRSFVDLTPSTHYREFAPHRKIRTDIRGWLNHQGAAGVLVDDLWKHNAVRRVNFRRKDGTGANLMCDLIPFRMPTSATSITLGSLSGNTYTPTVYNQAIRWDGVLAGAGDSAHDIAGVLLSQYVNMETEVGAPADLMGQYTALTLDAGDIVWIVRNGDYYMRFGAATANNGAFISAANGIGTPGRTWAASTASMDENLAGHGTSKVIGFARETVGAAGLFLADIQLPSTPPVRP